MAMLCCIKNGRPAVNEKIKEINIKCEIPEKGTFEPYRNLKDG